ncbi:MAG: cellulose binding domain-containing protein [Gammaproteobacteria bacterium]
MNKSLPNTCAAILALSLTGAALPVSALPMAGNTPNVLSFGVGNSPVGGIERIGDMPVGYRYQYFTGGLGADDWRHWNTPDGAFADLWLNESREAGLMPVLTYYELVHAAPYTGEDPPFNNLQVPATMKAYFENWIFLLQRIAAFGEPAIVHLEPDLFGYMQWNSSDPTQTPVAVASSGLAQAAGYENNARGFAKLMVALRDRYAPKVILGWHVSNWATRTDLILNQGDPDQLALATAEFYRALGASFDVTFAEFSDRDSGYYQKQGSPERWWKAADFDTFRRFLARLSAELGQEIILWQIPIGNTLYQSSNNTTGHYQDNRPEYFLQPLVDSGDTAHLAQYRDAGVAAFLFGAGQDDQTKYFDARGDGITNPTPIDNRSRNHSDHLNDRPALNADDDGGFLRLGIKTYYANGPLPLQRAPVACNDGIDNDGDGLIDFPADPGCTSASDNTETQPLPACSDGRDNDQDGLIDFPNDPGCAAADDDNEFNPTPPVELPAQLSISADWGSGYCADVAVTNNSGDALEWQTHFTVQGTIDSLWNAVYVQDGDQVRATGMEWNKTLASGAGANFGFCAQRPAETPQAACADGIDNDGDGWSDFPADPGCTSSDDNDESDTSASDLQTTLKIDSDWQSGYCATVTVKNPGTAAQIWDVSLSVEGRISDLWNAIYSQNGGTLSAHGYDWNKSVKAGGTVDFGFCAAR